MSKIRIFITLILLIIISNKSISQENNFINDSLYTISIKYILQDSLDAKYYILLLEQQKYGNILIVINDDYSNLPEKIEDFNIIYSNETEICDIKKNKGREVLYIGLIEIGSENNLFIPILVCRYWSKRKKTYRMGTNCGSFGFPNKFYIRFYYDCDKQKWILNNE